MPRRAAPVPDSVADAIKGLVAKEPILTTYGALAERVDVAEDMVRRAVATLKKSGSLRVLPAGRQGVRLAVVSPKSASKATERTARRAGMPVAAVDPVRPTARGRRRADGYCPWCGTAALSQWRFCAKCGKPLSAAKQ